VSRAVAGYGGVMTTGQAGMPALPWDKPRRRRPAKAPLTRERIVDAAIKILDRDGLDAVSTRKIAEDLGTGSASLYAHVSSRDELVELMVDRIAGEIEVPAPDPEHWQDQLREYAWHAHRVWSAHADIVRTSLATIPTGPGRLRVVEGLLAIMTAAGFPDQVAGWATDRLQIYIDADAYEGWLFTLKIKQGVDLDEYLTSIREYYRQLPADRFPILSGQGGNITGDGERRFEFGLELILAGLAALRPEAS
jgi:AcrR family transcriptional regulator